MRRDLNDEAIFMARLVVELLPHEPEALGLLAVAAPRRIAPARTAQCRWRICTACGPGSGLLERIADRRSRDPAPPGLRDERHRSLSARSSVAIGACASSALGDDNWAEICSCTTQSRRSPARRRDQSALAIAELRGPRDAILQSIADVRFTEYQPYWAARAELLSRTAARDEARHAYEIAIGLERDPAVRAFLRKRQASLAH